MRKLQDFFSSSFIKISGLFYSRTIDEMLLGEKYKVLRGTFKDKPDYDDGWIFALAQEAKTVFDVGSNIGQAAMLIMHSMKVEEIVLIDPNPSALAMAATNLIVNGRSSNARFVCAFASEESGENVEFFTIGVGAAGSMYSGHAKTASKVHASYSVPTITLDGLSQKYALIPDLIKIDTEGAESQVLNGAVDIAQHQKTKFLVEMHSQPELGMVENATKVLDWCQVNHYQSWYLKEKQRLTDPAQIAHRGRCHLLLIPINESFPRYLIPIKQGERLEAVQL